MTKQVKRLLGWTHLSMDYIVFFFCLFALLSAAAHLFTTHMFGLWLVSFGGISISLILTYVLHTGYENKLLAEGWER